MENQLWSGKYVLMLVPYSDVLLKDRIVDNLISGNQAYRELDKMFKDPAILNGDPSQYA
jgi:hypothetical protein